MKVSSWVQRCSANCSRKINDLTRKLQVQSTCKSLQNHSWWNTKRRHVSSHFLEIFTTYSGNSVKDYLHLPYKLFQKKQNNPTKSYTIDSSLGIGLAFFFSSSLKEHTFLYLLLKAKELFISTLPHEMQCSGCRIWDVRS